MPLYEYKCSADHYFDLWTRKADDMQQVVVCEVEGCGCMAVLQLSTFSVKMGEQSVMATSNWRRERACPNGHTYDGSYFGDYCPRCRHSNKITMGGPDARGRESPNVGKTPPSTATK